MAQTLQHTLTNWLLIMHRCPRLRRSSLALQGALHICCLDSYSWNWVGMCFVTLLIFAYVRIPWEVRLDVGKSTKGTGKEVTCMSRTNYMSFFYALANWEENSQNYSQNNLLNLMGLIAFTLETLELFILTTSVLRIWNYCSCQQYWAPYSDVHPQERNSKHSTYHQWCALPTKMALVTRSGHSSKRRGTCDGKSAVHLHNLWGRGSNLIGGSTIG